MVTKGWLRVDAAAVGCADPPFPSLLLVVDSNGYLHRATNTNNKTQTHKIKPDGGVAGWKKEKRCKGKSSVVGRSCRGETVMADGGWSEEQGGGWLEAKWVCAAGLERGG